MISVTKDYSGRKLDIELLRHVEAPGTQRVVPSADASSLGPGVVAGMEKVVQRYTKLFLTRQGSVKFDQSAGGPIIGDMRAGKVQSVSYLSFVADLSSASAVREMKRDDENEVFGDQPPDERIDKATVVGVDLDERTSTAMVHVVLVTEAGSVYSFVVPVRHGASGH